MTFPILQDPLLNLYDFYEIQLIHLIIIKSNLLIFNANFKAHLFIYYLIIFNSFNF